MDKEHRHDNDAHPEEVDFDEAWDGFDLEEEPGASRRRPTWMLQLVAVISLVVFIGLS